MKHNHLSFQSSDPAITSQFSLFTKYLDRQVTELTSRQCEVMLPLLRSFGEISYGELASQLGVSNATVSKSLKSAGWTLIEELLIQFQSRLEKEKYGSLS